MTAILVIENVTDLNEYVTHSANAVNLPYYAGRLGMEAGERITVLEALYAIMLPSANDTARALAEHVAGSVPEFVEMMNRRAAELGAYNTRFINPCGLPGTGQHVTAYDMALIKNAAIQHPLYAEIISAASFELPPTNMYEYTRTMWNSNLMVRPANDNFNPRSLGGKTGFTNAAQHTLISYAEYDGLEIIISVLYASPRAMIFSDTAALIEYIFENFPKEEPAPEQPFLDFPELFPVFAYESPQFTISEWAVPLGNYEPITGAVFTGFAAEHPVPQDISTTEAVAVASVSVALATSVIFLIKMFDKNPL
jgi:D-alanyl-D-alanine carboxypeptidase